MDFFFLSEDIDAGSPMHMGSSAFLFLSENARADDESLSSLVSCFLCFLEELDV